ncbi:porin [Pleionea litopenaei]|uniref:Porin n=1 Tax=Pleionea litopenaei TaxID=3070815 RepID=A0AA51RQP3_9GAMM|nr:porin [Pleionea sp. HL-JVS1]WMS85830.1 porin [Pleionea sp. HL-JVS1]
MKKQMIVTAIASVLSVSAFAGSPSFDFVEGGYADNYETDGMLIRGNKTLNDNFFLTASYETVGENGVDLNSTLFGLGYKFDLDDSSAIYTKVSYFDFEVDAGAGSESDDGFELGLGYRTQISKATQIYTEVNHLEVDSDSATQLVIGARQSFAGNLGAFIEVKKDDFDNDGFALGLNYSF